MALKHHKMRWPDHAIPAGEPTWLFCEVENKTDNVLRLVELFEDGASQRNSLALEGQKGSSVISLIPMSFIESIADHSYELITAEMFDDLYADATDRPD